MKQTQHTRSIKRQMALTMGTVSLLSILILGIATGSGLIRMRTQTLHVNEDMGSQAANDSRALLQEEAMEQLSAMAEAKAETVDANIASIISQVDVLASAATRLYANPSHYQPIPIYPPDAANQGIYTAQVIYAQRTNPAAVAAECGLLGNLTGQMNGVSEYLAGAGTTQIGTASGMIIMCDENSSLKTSIGHLEPLERSWYRGPAESGKMVWSDVFEDTFGRGLAVTCGKPIYGPDGTVKAVVSIGSTLDDVGTSVTNLTIGETGYAFVVSHNGDIIMSKNLTVDEEGHVVGTRNLFEDPIQAVHDIAGKIAAGERGVEQVTFDGNEVYMAFEPMENMPWSVVTIVSINEVLAPSKLGEYRISKLADQANNDITGIIQSTALLFLGSMVLAIATALALGYANSVRITRPLSQLTRQVEQIRDGNLDAKIEITTGDEIQTLGDAFNQMTASMHQYIRDLTTVTAEKERIGAELSVATQIQKDMLPNIFPAFPDRSEFNIYATMAPAKEVGGDFYDFFLVDDSHLAVIMADVSGKGVPAALFMVIAKTIIKNQALAGDSLDQVFAHANDQLCENNGEGLFVTAFMGLLDLKTGNFTYVNAGHNPPLLRRKGQTYEYLKLDPGFVLAGLDGITYKTAQLTLHEGDTLFLYTDGVTEALNPEQELYGEDRLRDALNDPAGRTLHVNQLLPYISQQLETFAHGADQADDITMLGLTFHDTAAGSSGMKTLTVPANIDQLDTVQAFVDEQLALLNCAPETVIQLQIAVEELFVNIAHYAYHPKDGVAVIGCDLDHQTPSITIQFRDWGTPFDPLAKKDADITLSADERDIGGLGIYMVKEYMDEISYVYEDGQNVVTMKKILN